jgi:hypothetical protein
MKPHEQKNRENEGRQKTKSKKRRKCNKMLRKKWKGVEKKFDKKAIKEKESKIKILSHKLLASTLSYLMLAPWWYTNHSNLSLRSPSMLSLVVICLFSHYRSILLPHYELVPSLDMSKSSQMMLHEFLLDWCHPQSLTYVIVLDQISSCVATNPS